MRISEIVQPSAFAAEENKIKQSAAQLAQARSSLKAKKAQSKYQKALQQKAKALQTVKPE